MVQHILLLYIARTGSSYLWQLFKNFKGVHVYGEVLNGPEKYLKPLNASSKLGIDDNTEAYRAFVKDNLTQYLEFLSKHSTEPYIFTKISLVHIANLIKQKSEVIINIIASPNTKVILLERNFIDTYVSLKKVSITSAWRDYDTTDIKITIDLSDFSEYCDRMSLLYRNIKEILASRKEPFMVSNYDDFHTHDDSDWNKLVKLQGSLLSQLGLRLDIDIERFEEVTEREVSPFMAKQDKNSQHKDKIQNYKAIQGLIEKKILEDPSLRQYLV